MVPAADGEEGEVSGLPPDVSDLHERLFGVVKDPRFESMEASHVLVAVASLLEHIVSCCSDQEAATRLVDHALTELRADRVKSAGVLP